MLLNRAQLARNSNGNTTIVACLFRVSLDDGAKFLVSITIFGFSDGYDRRIALVHGDFGQNHSI